MLLYLALLAALVLVVSQTFKPGGTTTELTTSEFTQAVQEGRVASVTYKARDAVLVGEYYKDDKAATSGTKSKYTSAFVGEDTLNQLMAEGIKINDKMTYNVDPQNTSPWFSFLTSLLPILLLVFVMFFFMNQMQGGNSKIMSFGKAKAKRMTRDQPRITFKDVSGADEAVEELQEIKEFLANPGKFQALGAKIPKGVLLVGPPGTGKTLLARAVAGEAAVPFFSISGSDFVEMFVGVGASRVRDLFEQAKAAAPCIIFMDEIDAVGRQRGAGLGGGHDEREQTLEPAARRDGRLRHQGQRHPHRGHEPPRHPRPRAPAPGPLRPPDRRRPPRPQGPRRASSRSTRGASRSPRTSTSRRSHAGLRASPAPTSRTS